MKSVGLLVVFLLTIELIQSATVKRTYIVTRDNPLSKKQLSNYTIRDSTDKNRLYRVKCSSSDIDQMIIFDYSKNTIIGNVEGEWIADKFNLSFSLAKVLKDPWIEGTIKLNPTLFRGEYKINWDGYNMLMRRRYYSRIIQMLDKHGNKVYGQFRRSSAFKAKVKYTMKIFFDAVPDPIYFLGLAIVDHRYQVEQIEG